MGKIEVAVVNAFIKKAKNSGLMPLIMRQMKKNYPFTEFYKLRYGREKMPCSIFSGCQNVEDMCKALSSIDNKSMNYNSIYFENEEYAKVNLYINHLLHFLIEGHVTPDKLQEIGEQVYYDSCMELFGRVDDKTQEVNPDFFDGKEADGKTNGESHDDFGSVDWFDTTLQELRDRIVGNQNIGEPFDLNMGEMLGDGIQLDEIYEPNEQ